MAFVLAGANEFFQMEDDENYDTFNDIQRELDGRKNCVLRFSWMRREGMKLTGPLV